MKQRNNRLRVGDDEIELDAAYIAGAYAARAGVGIDANPCEPFTVKSSNWARAHDNEHAGLHTVDGTDIIGVERDGKVFTAKVAA